MDPHAFLQNLAVVLCVAAVATVVDTLARLTGTNIEFARDPRPTDRGQSQNARENKKAASMQRGGLFVGWAIRPPRADAWFAAAPRISSC